jgi:ATP-binding cassette subfamily F protein uup
LVSVQEVKIAFGGPELLDGVTLQIERGERVCLVGRNGAGKSTLMKIMSGGIIFDSGEVIRANDARAAILEQDAPQDLQGTVFEVVSGGLGGIAELLPEYHLLSRHICGGEDAGIMAELQRVQHLIESSAGWLEEFLLQFRGALLFITHDRRFLETLSTRIIELDRGRVTDWPRDYKTYLARRQVELDAETTHNALFDRKLAREEAWIRQGIKTRRTRNQSRVRALKELRLQRLARRMQTGSAEMRLNEAERSGRLVLEAEAIGHNYEGRPLIREFSTVIMLGDKIGIIGPNGSGKTTLLNILLGSITPAKGSVRMGTGLEVAYFDQHRRQLDDEKSLRDNVGNGCESVTVNGKTRHIIGYLEDFLFPPERAMSPVKVLSGGERNRVLLAKRFTRPSNVLVLDEPTNDLDADTLELLEEMLMECSGTVLLVSHGREFFEQRCNEHNSV